MHMSPPKGPQVPSTHPFPHPGLFPVQAPISEYDLQPPLPFTASSYPLLPMPHPFPALIMIEVFSLRLTAQLSRPRQAPSPLMVLTQRAWFPPTAPQASHLSLLLEASGTPGKQAPRAPCRGPELQGGSQAESLRISTTTKLNVLSTYQLSDILTYIA